ncbi:PREDICTED: dedicator of cytokinesis protein 1-like [Papilio polytes]|uniref:dedicator of cytokinesis protein 1-like n=1 Tax=Papilio polytes TaxID=76194 RepID=UPI000676026D|nr:PREDICTED: dedicator of cytokinesis protein 1-like [Papilio polytes]
MQREGTTTPDNQHNLCVYKIDNKRAGSDVEVEAAAVCLGLPSKRDELPAGAEKGLTRAPLSLVYRDSLTVATKLCSTKLTQREEILGVLKWSTHHEAGSLRAALERLLLVPSEELVKFLQDILDALFAILTQVEEEGEYSEQSYGVLVLECLLRVISLVADHKYQHFQPVLHVYIDESFCDALAYQKLISVLVWAVRAADGGEAALKRLLLCMKCLESLMRLIVRSWQLRAALDTHTHHADPVCYHLEELLEALVWLMRCGDHALTCQGSALKYLPHAVPHAIKIFPEVELSAYCVRALDALPLGRLSKQRLLSLLELARGELGREPAARARLLPHLAATLRALLRASAECEREAAHKSRSAGKAARLLGADAGRLREHTHHAHIVELCVETMGEVVSLLARDDVGAVEADRGEFARRMLPTVLKTTATMLRDRAVNKDGTVVDDPLVRRMVCVLLDVVRQMSEEQYSLLVRALQHERNFCIIVLKLPLSMFPGEHKRSFIPALVGPFLEVSFLPDDEVRNTTIPLFYDMMITEYSHSLASGENCDNPLRTLESELIDKVDVLASRGLGDGAWRARFVSACGARCREGGAGGAGAALVAAAARQLDALLQYRAAAQHRMHLTTRVLRFYEQIERPHMYIRYVHKLAQMHSGLAQWAEAGLALRIYIIFPESGFVYRGNEYEQLQEFKERLLDEWPDAEVLPRLDPPGDDITHSDGQYLQINAVEPVMGDKLKRLSGRPVAEQILQYYKHNNVDKFVFSRPFHKPDDSVTGSNEDVSSQNEFATRWLERTELEISDKLPGILRWFPVVSVRTYWVSPLEAAVEALRETNRALKALVLEARTSDAPLHQLSMRLNGM